LKRRVPRSGRNADRGGRGRAGEHQLYRRRGAAPLLLEAGRSLRGPAAAAFAAAELQGHKHQRQPNDPEIVSARAPIQGSNSASGRRDVKGKVQLAPALICRRDALASDHRRLSRDRTSPSSYFEHAYRCLLVREPEDGRRADGEPHLPDSGTYKGSFSIRTPALPYGDSLSTEMPPPRSRRLLLPSRRLNFNGTSGLTTRCIPDGAKQLVFSGNASVRTSVRKPAAASRSRHFVRLVA
jgi:hypothetical protein